MFRSHGWLRAMALSAAIVASAAVEAIAQTRPAPCAAPDLVGDLGFSTSCTRCVMTGLHVPGRADIEFATEPMLSGIKMGGPADGKLVERDVLVAVDGLLITTQAGAVQYSWLSPGKPVRITVRRGGALKDVEIVPAPRCRTITPDFPRVMTGGAFVNQLLTPSPLSSAPRGWFGITVSCVACGPGLFASSLTPFGSYLDVTDVTADSPADSAGLKTGDLLIAMDGLSLKSAEGAAALRSVKPNQKVSLLVVRDGEVLKIALVAGRPR